MACLSSLESLFDRSRVRSIVGPSKVKSSQIVQGIYFNDVGML